MSKLPWRAAWKLALILTASGLAVAAIGSAAWAVDPSPATPGTPLSDVAADAGDAQTPIPADEGAPLLPDRPDLANVTGNVLGPLYINHTAGIEFHVPLGSKKVLQVSQDILAEFDDPGRRWELKVAMVVRDTPTVLTTNPTLNPNGAVAPTTNPSTRPAVAGQPTNGLMEKTLELLKRTLPEAKVLREDLTSLPNGNTAIENNVGLLTIRYTVAGQRRLAQQALIQASDRVFYVLTLTSPGKPEESSPGDDPREVDAVNTFRHVLDSVTLLDRAAIRREQENRLYCTRTLFVNLTPERLKAALIPEQWLRVIHDGKDVGYTYICEQQAGDIPRLGQAADPNAESKVTQHVEVEKPVIPPGDDLLIGIRSRLFTDGMRSNKTNGPIIIDNESWLFSGIERNHEEWSRETLIDDRLKSPDGKPDKPQFIEELGDSNKRLKEALVRVPPDAPIGTKPEMQTVTDYRLDVEEVNTGAALPPISRQLPPFYTPQAISHLMPRLLPLHEPQGYLFAEYVGDAREVMMRYMDVLPKQAVNIMGKSVIAIPIDDRVGLDGTVTTHYFSPAGKYLGSETRDTDTWVIPSTSDAIEKIWAGNALLAVPHAIANHHGEAAAQ
ncbi:MAG TPA: hypothetical protein VHY37_08365 [Tepidisphaeraceae bacterium]|nr:hypothetical protein [Tepidisphaeraceae bacterium]